MTIRQLSAEEIDRALFLHFVRRQIVTKCLRKTDGVWREADIAFVDDWTENDYHDRARKIRRTAETGGAVFGAFVNGELKGFATVEAVPLGSRGQYLDLSRMHVSQDMRGRGIGRALFGEAALWAGAHGAQKLYLSAHSAVESQAFYRAMGCVEAVEYDRAHVEDEPGDCQMEYVIAAEGNA